MKQLVKHTLLLVALLLGANNLFAQREPTLYMMDNVYQASYVNPSVIPQSQLSIGLPGISSIYVGQALSFSGKDVIDGNTLSPSTFINSTKGGVYSLTFANVDLFSARVKIRKTFMSFSARTRVFSKLMIDKDILDLAWNGNGSMLGQDISLDKMANNATAYHELGLGFAREFDKWTLGAKIKANFGVANISSQTKEADLNFDETTYEANLKGSYTANTSNVPGDGLELDEKDYLKLNTKNFGLGIDLGASYKVNDKLKISASVVDLGYIKWNDNTRNYNLKVDGTVKGIDVISALVKGEKMDTIVERWGDGLDKQADYSTTEDSYSTMLHGQVYLNGQYSLAKSLKAYGTVNMFLWKGLRTSATLGLRKEFGRSFSVTLNNTAQYKRLFNIGLGVMFKPGPFQFYMVFDNLYLGELTQYQNDDIIVPQYITNANVRLGINLVFGKVHSEDKI